MLHLILSILIGALAGYLASRIMKTANGFWINVLIGIVGGWLGGWLLGIIGIHWCATTIGSIVTAVIGAVVLLWIISKIRK